jgi:hypothetical protein
MDENDPAAIKLVTEYTRYTRQQLSAFLGTTCLRITASNSEDTAFRPHATASLFSIAGLHFLVTAAHIFEDDPPSLWAEAVHGETVHGKEQGKRIRIDEHPRWTHRDIDLGIVYLGDDFVAALEGMRFLTMQDVELNIPTEHPARWDVRYLRVPAGAQRRRQGPHRVRVHDGPVQWLHRRHRLQP